MQRSRYSAQVVLKLAIAGQVIALSQVGPGFVVLQETPEESTLSGYGRVDVIIDNRIASSNEHFFPHGIVSGSKYTSFF
ncbi:hypothetical protein CKO51_11720 [Rhodopirellula sp. SM50]|nr:hypothetical protein CKO51_11720 [Rhodopirellula sp. SM50]